MWRAENPVSTPGAHPGAATIARWCVRPQTHRTPGFLPQRGNLFATYNHPVWRASTKAHRPEEIRLIPGFPKDFRPSPNGRSRKDVRRLRYAYGCVRDDWKPACVLQRELNGRDATLEGSAKPYQHTRSIRRVASRVLLSQSGPSSGFAIATTM